MRLLVLCGVLLALSSVPALAEPVAPGVDATLTITPSTGYGEMPVESRARFENTNMSVVQVYQLDMRVVAPDGSEYNFSGPFTRTVEGQRQFDVTFSIPPGTRFVGGSLKINGLAVPDPTIENDSFSMRIIVPGATGAGPGILEVVHTVDILLTVAEMVDRVIVNTARLESSGGFWAVAATAVGVLFSG